MPMEITDTSLRPFQKVSIDIVGPLTETYTGYSSLLTFEHDLTKYMDCVPLPNTEAATVAAAFVE